MNKNYRLKIENTKRGTELKVSDYQPMWVAVLEGVLLLGAVGYTYLKLISFN